MKIYKIMVNGVNSALYWYGKHIGRTFYAKKTTGGHGMAYELIDLHCEFNGTTCYFDDRDVTIIDEFTADIVETTKTVITFENDSRKKKVELVNSYDLEITNAVICGKKVEFSGRWGMAWREYVPGTPLDFAKYAYRVVDVQMQDIVEYIQPISGHSPHRIKVTFDGKTKQMKSMELEQR